MEEEFNPLNIFLKKMFKDKKAQTGGLIMGLVFGVASLVIGVIIAFVIVSTLTGAGLFDSVRDTTYAYNTSAATAVNETGSHFGNYTLAGAICTVDYVYNLTGGSINSGNYTYDSSLCKIYFDSGSTGLNNTVWRINSTTTYDGTEEITVTALNANFTEGVNNVSSKIPTVLLVAAIVLILSILVLLVVAWQRMRLSGGGI